MYDTVGDAEQAFDRAAIKQVGKEADTFLPYALYKAEALDSPGQFQYFVVQAVTQASLFVSSCV